MPHPNLTGSIVIFHYVSKMSSSSQFIPVIHNEITFINPSVITYLKHYPQEKCLEVGLDYNKISGTTIPRRLYLCKDTHDVGYNMLLKKISANESQ